MKYVSAAGVPNRRNGVMSFFDHNLLNDIFFVFFFFFTFSNFFIECF